MGVKVKTSNNFNFIAKRSDSVVQNDQSSSLKIEEWMTTEEAAEFLRVPAASLLNLSSNGKVPFYKWQRRNRYLKSDLLGLLLSTKRGTPNGS